MVLQQANGTAEDADSEIAVGGGIAGYKRGVLDILHQQRFEIVPVRVIAGRPGEIVELNFYQTFARPDHLKQLIQLTHPLPVKPGVVPTAYAIAKLVTQGSAKGALVLDADDHRTEAILVADSHLVGIKSFDVGATSLDLYTVALESALEDMDYDDLWPEKIFISGNSQHHEALRSKLIAYPWTKNFNMLSFPEISLFHPLSVNLTQPADVGLNALSLLV